MKIRPIILSLCGMLILSCKNKETKDPKPAKTIVEVETEEEEIPVKMCYLYATAKDTISLNIEKLDHSVTGSLVYMLQEKDVNRGQVSGEIKGDTIFAEYSFVSEGKTTVKPILFLKKDNQLIEGFKHKDSTGYSFRENFPLTRTNCGVN